MSSVSVVIPTFNRAKVLGRALRSVFDQSITPDEVIVVDDGSTDDTASLVQNEFPDAVYIAQENRGVSAARNVGIAASQGDWIAFLDSDDEWLPKKLETQLELLVKSLDAKVCHTEEIWVRNGRRVNQMKKHAKTGGWIYHRCLPICAMSPSSIVIHRDIFDQVGLFDEDLPACEDYDLWLRICASNPVVYFEEPMIIKYGGHDDQLSSRFWGMDRFRIQALAKILRLGDLTPENNQATLAMLDKKLSVLMQGAIKRKNNSLIAQCEALRVEFY